MLYYKKILENALLKVPYYGLWIYPHHHTWPHVASVRGGKNFKKKARLKPVIALQGASTILTVKDPVGPLWAVDSSLVSRLLRLRRFATELCVLHNSITNFRGASIGRKPPADTRLGAHMRRERNFFNESEAWLFGWMELNKSDLIWSGAQSSSDYAWDSRPRADYLVLLRLQTLGRFRHIFNTQLSIGSVEQFQSHSYFFVFSNGGW